LDRQQPQQAQQQQQAMMLACHLWVCPVSVLLTTTFISYLHFLRRVRFWVLILILRRHETEWRVRPCGQRSEDVQMAIADPSVLDFLDVALTFLTQLQKCLAVTLFLDTIIYITQIIPSQLGCNKF
jgi:hypothetical protein